MKRLILGVLTLVVVFLGFRVVWAEYIKQTTGVLVAQAFDSSATLTVTQAGHQAVNIGTGKDKIRLAPGHYQLIATDGQAQSTASFTIIKAKTTVETLGKPLQKQAIQDNSQANALIQLLPYSGPGNEYSISYSYKYTSGVATPQIIISAPTPQAKQNALKWISSVGFDPTKLPIIFPAASSE